MAEQPALPLTPPLRCVRCNGTGEVYYHTVRAVQGNKRFGMIELAEIVGGKRATCPECNGTKWVGTAGDG